MDGEIHVAGPGVKCDGADLGVCGGVMDFDVWF